MQCETCNAQIESDAQIPYSTTPKPPGCGTGVSAPSLTQDGAKVIVGDKQLVPPSVGIDLLNE